MKMCRLAVFALISVLAGAVTAACGGSVAAPAVTPAAAASQPQVQEVIVKASEWKFEPAIIRVRAGQPLKLVFQNWGQENHDLVLKGMEGQEGGKQENVAELVGWVKQETKEGHMEAMDEHHKEGDMHDMHIDAQAGHMSALMVTPMQPGTYALECSYEGHTEQGQKATLIVEQ